MNRSERGRTTSNFQSSTKSNIPKQRRDLSMTYNGFKFSVGKKYHKSNKINITKVHKIMSVTSYLCTLLTSYQEMYANFNSLSLQFKWICLPESKTVVVWTR